jgi:hypothetical protein
MRSRMGGKRAPTASAAADKIAVRRPLKMLMLANVVSLKAALAIYPALAETVV